MNSEAIVLIARARGRTPLGYRLRRKRIVALIEQAEIVILVIGTSEGLLFELGEVYKRRGVRKLVLVWDAFGFGANASAVHLKTAWSDFRMRFEEITGIDLPRRIDSDRSLLLCFLPNEELRIIIGKRRTAEEWYAAFRAARSLIVGREPDLARGNRQRQVIPWIIFVWYSIQSIGFLAASRSMIDTPLPLIVGLMNLIAAVLLLKLKKAAVWLFAASLAISLVNGLIVGVFVRPPYRDISFWIAVILLDYGVLVATCIFSWRRFKHGALR